MFTDMYLQMQQNSRQFLCVRSKSNDVEIDFVWLLLILTVSSSTGDVLDQQYQMVHILASETQCCQVLYPRFPLRGHKGRSHFSQDQEKKPKGI